MTTTAPEIPTDEEFNAAIEKLEAVYGSDADPFVSVIETVRDEETVHDGSHEEFTDGCMGCFTERLADAITRVVVGGEAWIVPKVPHDETVAVTPRILPGGLIVSSEGASDPDHARHYAAQLLAAADTSEGMTLRSDV